MDRNIDISQDAKLRLGELKAAIAAATSQNEKDFFSTEKQQQVSELRTTKFNSRPTD